MLDLFKEEPGGWCGLGLDESGTEGGNGKEVIVGGRVTKDPRWQDRA